jgi:aldehyde dehydrogenase (NAD+)
MSIAPVAADVASILDRLGVPRAAWTGGARIVRSPVTGEEIGAAREH